MFPLDIYYKIFYITYFLFLGNKNNCLTTDGLFDPSPESIDVRQFTNFFMFMSTIQGYVSMRHPSHGKYIIYNIL